jgi:hypothetical protein
MTSRPVASRRFKFRAAEDEMLHALVDRFGTGSWPEVAALMPGRNPRQCRDRWNHYLKQRTILPWTSPEDALLLRAVADMGRKWDRIAALLPHRTNFDIRSRWHELTVRHESEHEARRACVPPPPPPPPSGSSAAKCWLPSLPIDPSFPLTLLVKRSGDVRDSGRFAEAPGCIQRFPAVGYGGLLDRSRERE